MNKKSEKMIKEERQFLHERAKKRISAEFNYIGGKDWNTIEKGIEENELSRGMVVFLNAKKTKGNIRCLFQSEYCDPYNRHKFFIYGENEIDCECDSVLEFIPTNRFVFLYEGEWVGEQFGRCIKMSKMDFYSGHFMLAGIVDEEPVIGGTIDIDGTELRYEIEKYVIDKKSPIWKKVVAESYRLFRAEQYKLAFLHLFIGFDSLIEYLNIILATVYQKQQNRMLENLFKNYMNGMGTPLEALDKVILKSESYQRLQTLENERRKLLDDKLCTILCYVNDLEKKEAKDKLKCFDKYNKLRNALAHGDLIKNKTDYKLEYCEFFGHIVEMIHELVK